MSKAESHGHGPSRLVTLVVGSTERSARRAKKAPPSGGPAPAGGGPARGGPAPAEAGTAQWSWQWSGGEPGPVVAGCEGEPALTLTLSPADAGLVARGELAPSVAYMQGRLKTTGDNALLLELLRWTATPAFEQRLSELQKDPRAAPWPAGTPS